MLNQPKSSHYEFPRSRRNAGRYRKALTTIVAGVLCIGSAATLAQTRYVSDELTITLRTGPSTQNAIIRNLVTGDPVTILEELPDSDYVRVRAQNGTEGWALSRYLTDTPVARDRLAVAERELAQARERIEDLQGTVDELSEQLSSVTQRMEEAETAATDLNTELVDVRSASANALTIRDQNESLRRRVNEQNQLIDALSLENSELSSRADREWFLLGAGVLVAGIVLGLIIPSLRRKRRTDW